MSTHAISPKTLGTPSFESAAFLRAHVAHTLQFYRKSGFDPDGGFFHYYLDDGSIHDRSHRHLVSATRFVFNWAQAFHHGGLEQDRTWARHALAHLDAFRLPHGLHAWTLRDGKIEDARIMAYGQAFVLLAYSHAHRIGLIDAHAIAEVFDRYNAAFWNPSQRAYADERSADGVLSEYRGQNANMHSCEACLAAFEVTQDERYLERAITLIQRFAFELADTTTGLVWEHYHTDWSADWDYNRDNPGDIFKPWGFQTGHQTEWAKLILMAHQHAPHAHWPARAAQLHDAAFQFGWDTAHGGLIYGFDPDRRPCDTDKYFWVQAETLASAWRLYRHTGEPRYREQYQRLWSWSWQHMVDHEHGAWWRILSADGRRLENVKSPAGKTDYHTMGACWDILDAGGLQD